ncbi:glycosyltransferase family 2 protein [Helicobacter cappadocius]|uniref:Glycosyltransferase family 2 protein n=1 Tax=Helicobacter cappadocius TaxID=3063998 RepID=A0AA90PLU0_9HELI|nr:MULTISPECIES: glycosyltransferase family 2 protein [unclassified Helicobacter]MDO7253601.1 glycosyltransferase family 2 protein [Helicobacter sp. faydin-H75]MDP2539529.1 glycosyltransferase family 2 protein [Helicobacter sp. faydin-H76]
MTNPKISIIIPAYNIEDSIARAIHSCIRQTLREIEIIIIDEKGSDKTIQIAHEYAQKDLRIRILDNQKNLGTFLARLQGAKIAKGEYLCFLDGDDYLEEETCRILYEKAEQHCVDIVFFGTKFFPPTLKKAPLKIITKSLQNEQILKEVFLLSSTPPWGICGKLYKKDLVLKAIKTLDFIDEHLVMAEDLLQNFVFIALGKSSVGISQKFYIYCESNSSITRDSKTRDKKINNLKRIIELFDELETKKELTSNPYFYEAKNKIQAILHSIIELEYRYDNTPKLAYLQSCIRSLKYHQKWQTYIRILSFIFSFGKIKL